MGTQMLVLVEAGKPGSGPSVGLGDKGRLGPGQAIAGWAHAFCSTPGPGGKWWLYGQHFKERARGYSGEIPKRMQGFEQ